MSLKRVTNETGTPIELSKLGVTLIPATPYTIQPAQYPFWAQYSRTGSQIEGLILSGDVTVSDGLTPALNPTLGIALLQDILARNISFDNRTNGFIADDVQAAIEEAQSGAVSSDLLLNFDCDSGAAVGDFVVASTSVDVKVTVVSDNSYANLVIGVIAYKPTATTCKVRVLGTQGGFSGLSRGKAVFISATGTATTTVPTGNLQIVGTAISATQILINVASTKTLR